MQHSASAIINISKYNRVPSSFWQSICRSYHSDDL